MRRALAWIGAFAVLLAASGGAVAAANATILGAGSFVAIYLDALARGDVAGALALPGADGTTADRALLTAAAVVGPTSHHELSDTDLGGGRHRVRVAWDSPTGGGTTDFTVEASGMRWGVFPIWRFTVAPMATLALDVQHDARFTANGAAASRPADATGPVDVAVLVPGGYVLDHRTAYLAATRSTTVIAADPGAVLPVTLDVQATPAFATAVAGGIRQELDACATQQVLYPTGCPFGQSIGNRLTGTPVWSLRRYPEVMLAPGATAGTWTTGEVSGTAHLVAPVQLLFDGQRSMFDADVPFTARYTATLGAADAITLTETG